MSIGITMGCPVGIGPEIILKLFHSFKRQEKHGLIAIGDINVLKRCRDELGFDLEPIAWNNKQIFTHSQIPVIEVGNLNVKNLQWGIPGKETGKAAGLYIEKGVELIQQGLLSGIVTCPISKESLNLGGFHYPGHTEMLARLTNSSNYAMMLAGDKLKVTLVTIHCPLKNVVDQLDKERIIQLIQITYKALSIDFGIAEPKIAVAGLNPHGGEQGMFGDEELKIIKPAIIEAKQQGICVYGPFPPDTIFVKASSGEYDTVVCMYHDQGLIPFKLLHFSDGVNITLGLPIIRTSVDHGTAYDIAGKGVADSKSLMSAVNMAQTIATNRSLSAQKNNTII